MTAVAAAVIATLTRERDEARAVARDLLGRCIALTRSEAESPWVFTPDPEDLWKTKYPWLRAESEDDPD